MKKKESRKTIRKNCSLHLQLKSIAVTCIGIFYKQEVATAFPICTEYITYKLLALQIDPSNNSKSVIRHGLEVTMTGSQAHVFYGVSSLRSIPISGLSWLLYKCAALWAPPMVLLQLKEACIELRAQLLFFVEIQGSIFLSFQGSIIFFSQILRAQFFSSLSGM